jgi:hypothetical protein
MNLWIGRTLDRDDDAWGIAQVSWLDSPLRGVEENVILINVHPDHIQLGAAVWIVRHHMSVGFLLKNCLTVSGISMGMSTSAAEVIWIFQFGKQF